MPSLAERFDKGIHGQDLHPALARTRDSLPTRLADAVDMLFYGPPGAGKYTQALRVIAKYSPSGLRYDRPLNVKHEKGQMTIRVSDVHFEIDMELLGCHARSLWPAIYEHVVDSVHAREPKRGIMLCKHFHATHKELLDSFYYYMGRGGVSVIIVTDHLGFIPRRVVERCLVVPVPLPSSARVIAAGLPGGRGNLASTQQAQTHLDDRMARACDAVWAAAQASDFAQLRITLYALLVDQHPTPACVWELVTRAVEAGAIHPLAATERARRFFALYNNNYRPIYHLELLALGLAHPGTRKTGEGG